MMEKNKKYYIVRNGKQEGPYSIQELKQIVLYPNTLIWYNSFQEWKTLKDIPELKDLITNEVPPPVPQEVQNVSVETNNAIQIELLKHKTEKSFWRKIKRFIVKELYFTLKLILIWIIAFVITSLCFLLFYYPPFISESKLTAYEEELNERKYYITNLIQANKNILDKKELTTYLVKIKGWDVRIVTPKYGWWSGEFEHIDLKNKYLDYEKIREWCDKISSLYYKGSPSHEIINPSDLMSNSSIWRALFQSYRGFLEEYFIILVAIASFFIYTIRYCYKFIVWIVKKNKYYSNHP